MKRRIVLEDEQIHTPGLEMRSGKELHALKAAAKEKYIPNAKAETLAGTEVQYIKIELARSNAWPIYERTGRPRIVCNAPHSPRALFYYLRECVRIVLGLTN